MIEETPYCPHCGGGLPCERHWAPIPIMVEEEFLREDAREKRMDEMEDLIRANEDRENRK